MSTFQTLHLMITFSMLLISLISYLDNRNKNIKK